MVVYGELQTTFRLCMEDEVCFAVFGSLVLACLFEPQRNILLRSDTMQRDHYASTWLTDSKLNVLRPNPDMRRP